MVNNENSIAVFLAKIIPERQFLPFLQKLQQRYTGCQIWVVKDNAFLNLKQVAGQEKENSEKNFLTDLKPARKTSFWKTIFLLRKQQFITGIIPLDTSKYQFPQFYRKPLYFAFLSKAKRINVYHLDTGKYSFLSRHKIFKTLFLPEFYLLGLACLMFPLSVFLLAVFTYTLIQSNQSRRYLKTAGD